MGMVTINDVAARAGVSTATVSRVLSGKQTAIPIGQATYQRVMDAVRELGYEPNAAARALAGQKSRTIGLVMYDIMHLTHPNFSQIVHGVAQGLSHSDFDLLLLPMKSKIQTLVGRSAAPRSVGSYYRQRKVDGLIVAAQERIRENVQELETVGCPYVLLGSSIPAASAPSVRSDAAQDIYLAASYLLELGHRRVAFINGIVGGPITDSMTEGYRRALSEAGQFDPGLLVNTDFTVATTRRLTEELMAVENPPTAIMAADDVVAVEVLAWANEHGYPVPDRLSVVGYADLPVAAALGLTTIRVAISETGRLASLLLLDMIEGRAAGARDLVLPSELVVRSTTAPPAGMGES